MKVKQLIEELQKLNPEMECIAKAVDAGYNSITEIKPIQVTPFHIQGVSYYHYDYIQDLGGYAAYELIAKSARK